MEKCRLFVVITTILCLFLSPAIGASTIVQAKGTKIEIKKSTMTLKQAVDEIQKSTGYSFFYKSDDLDMTITKDIQCDGDINEVLESVFADTDVAFTVKGKEVLLQKKSDSNTKQSTLSNQDKRTIKGVVTDESGMPIIGATVVEKGTSNGSISNIDGEFSLSLSGNFIQVSSIGYATQVVTITKEQDTYKIVLAEDSKLLDEVVVVGYGVQKKVNLTGSVASISTDDIKDRVQTDVLSAIQGTVPGVTVISRPGQTPSINFRGRGNLGTSSPLYVIDGVISDATFFSNLDPNSIESVSFLKDAASSAIYGSRAAYGVVLVTTKEGKQDRIRVNYNAFVGTKIASYIPKTVNSVEYAEMLNEARYNNNPDAGKYQAYSEEEIGWFGDGSKPDYYPDSDWFDLVLDKNVITTRHSLDFSGGSERIKYFTGLGYTYDDSHMPGNDMQRYNFNINLSANVTEWLTLHSGMKYIKRTSERDRGSVGGIHLLVTPPTMVAQQSNGEWGSINGGKQATQTFMNYNPLRILSKNDWSNSNNEYTMYDLGFDIKPLEGLVVTGQGSYKRSETKSKTYTGLQDDVAHFETGNAITGTGNAINKMDMSWGSSSTLLTTLTATYDKKINNHSFTVLAGTSYEDYKYEGLSASRRNFPSDILEDLNAGSSAGTDITNGGGMSSNRMLSYFARLNYNFSDRYLLEANIRGDASSRFHKDQRWGYFPSFSGAWRISEEDFMKNEKGWLDNLKVRASWGKLGNINNVGDYDYFMKYGIGSNYNFDDVVAMGIVETKIANPALGWETVALTDFGIDADFWGGKLSVVADYYIKETNDILLQYNVPYETGISAAPSQNIGQVKNTGFEFAINHRNKIGEVSYSIGANLATNKNRIISLAGSDNMIQSGGDKIQYILKEGESIGSFFGYKTDGLYTQEEIDAGHYYTFGRKPNAGDIKYVPQRENVEWGSAITADDRTVIGKDVPDLTYGLNLSLNWKDFEFSVFGQGVSGTSVAFESEQVWAFFLQSTPRELHKKRWTLDNPNSNAPYPRIYGGTSLDNYNQNFSDYQVFDADYFRIKTISLGYMVPKPVTSKLGLQSLKFFVTGENLFTIRADKDMEDFDPEAYRGRGIGSFNSKSLAFGVNVSF